MPSEEAPRFHVVGPHEGSRPRRPGPAVLSILLYAALFGGALWYLRAKSPLFHRAMAPGRPAALATRRPAGPTAGAPALPISRDALLSGEKLPVAARAGYFRRLATDRCDCGCGRTLSDCLANEPACARSPAQASQLKP
jgi:hypothetical protein